MDRKKELLIRAYLVMLFFIVLSLVIVYRVFNISVVEGEKWRSKGSNHIKWMTVPADRGSIYADDGSLLVTTLPFFDIGIDPKVSKEKLFNSEIDSLCIGLTKLTGKGNPSEWKRKIVSARKKGKQYLSIVRNVNADDLSKYQELPLFREGRFKGGFLVDRHSKREKPYGQFASRTIGEDRENASKVGLEDYFDKFLKGPEEKRLMRRVTGGEWLPLQELSEHEVQKGDDLYTTINITMQDIVHHALMRNLIEYEAKEGTAIVMEVETGAIKAISNFGRTSSGGYAELYNYGVGKSTEPGSTFKLASVLAMIDAGYADLNTKVDLGGGKKKFYDRTMYDSHMHGIYSSDLREAFEISSNVGVATLTQQFFGGSTELRKKYVNKLCQFGLCENTGIEIRGEEKPFVKDPVANKKTWYGTTIPWMSHGYELEMTPLQLLNFYNAIANDGKLMKPYLVDEIRSEHETVKKFKPIVLKDKIATDKAIKAAQKLLRGVVLRGTAKNLRSDVVSAAGKTGTTVVGYENKDQAKRYNASFAGYFPADHPKYSMIVVVYEPKGKYYGSSVAAPVFKEVAEKFTVIDLDTQERIEEQYVMEENIKLPEAVTGNKNDFKRIFDYVGLEYKDKARGAWVDVDPYETKMLIDNKRIRKSAVPDVRGMGARDALYVLENLGMKVDLNGVGKVYKQSITPGADNKGQPIKIYLN